jgi:uncharacterized protein (DUF1697 family)
MSDLRVLVEGLGHSDVETYIQSGNLVFASSGGTAATVAKGIEKAIRARFGFEVAVLLRTKAQLTAVVKGNPFPTDAPKVHVAFLTAAPKAAAVKTIDPAPFAPDEFTVKGKEIYLHLPNGMGRAKLNPAFFERKLGVTATARNWATVNKLITML